MKFYQDGKPVYETRKREQGNGWQQCDGGVRSEEGWRRERGV